MLGGGAVRRDADASRSLDARVSFLHSFAFLFLLFLHFTQDRASLLELFSHALSRVRLA